MAAQPIRQQAALVTTRARVGRRSVSDPEPAAASKPAFVGRDEEFGAVLRALADPPALVLIEGEAGIGKTRLLREVLHDPRVRVRAALIAVCPPLREPFPFWPIVDAVRRLGRRPDLARLSPLGGALRPLFPEWAEELPPALDPLEDPKETKHRIFGTLTELVDLLSVDVLVVEDAHWADAATLEWLLTLAVPGRSVSRFLLTYRPTDIPDDSVLMRLTSRLPLGVDVLRVELEPFDMEQTRTLVTSMLGTEEASDEFADFVREHTDGVPLAVEETIRLLRERHDIRRRDRGWIRRALDALEVPPTVRDSVLERVSRLDPDAREVLRASAVLGEPADEVLLTAVCGLDEHMCQQGIGRGLASGLLRDGGEGRVVFRHALDAAALVEAMPASERWRLHRAAGRALQHFHPEAVVRLAHHFREANDADLWCHYAEASADLAWESGDGRAAVATLLEVLGAVDHPLERRARLASKLSEFAFFGTAMLGDLSTQVVDVLREVLNDDSELGVGRQLGQTKRGELRLMLGRMLWEIGEEVAAFDEFEAAIPDLDHRPDLAVRAMCNLALAVRPECSAAQHLHWLDCAGELLASTGTAEEVRNHGQLRVSRLLLLGDERGWQAFEKLLDAAAEATSGNANLLLDTAWAALVWGRYMPARQALEMCVHHVETIRYQRNKGSVRLAEAYLHYHAGMWSDLHDVVAGVAEDAETNLALPLYARQLLALLEFGSGARSAAKRLLGESCEDYARLGIVDPILFLAPAALGRLSLADDDPGEALRLTRPIVEAIAGKDVWLWATDVAPVHVDALILSGSRSEAESFVAEFAVGLGDRDAPAARAALGVCQAQLVCDDGEHTKAAALFADTAAAYARLPRPYDELLALERRGRCLLAAGEQDDGLAILSDSEERLGQLGAPWDADRVAHVLREHGVDVVRSWRGGRRGYGDQLSPRESEVVALVARGMTNKEIAAALFISHRTVGMHVSTAMRKLGVSSRVAVAMAASERGLLLTQNDP